MAQSFPGGEPHYIIVVEDISDRKSAEDRYRTTFDKAPIGIMHSTQDRRILHVNPKLCEILGYSRDELLGMTTADILPPGYRDTSRPHFFDKMINGQPKLKAILGSVFSA